MEQSENRVTLRGRVGDAPVFSHSVLGEDFYKIPLVVPRLSGREDQLNILFSSSIHCPQPGVMVEVQGRLRTFNNRSGVGSRLIITVLAYTMTETEEEPCNLVVLSGAICKPPVLRRTPLGREICDLLLAVNRRYRKADYLPCIAWGSTAEQCSRLHVGDSLRLMGRLQSRTYYKSIGSITEERVAFEVSISELLECVFSGGN